jgi:hypothetical protein
MLISGPRTSNLGEEIGTTACSLMVGQGGDHISSSTLFHYQNATCFYGTSYIKSNGGAYYSGSVGIGTETPVARLEIFGTGNTLRLDSVTNGSKTILLRNVGTCTSEIKTDGNLDFNIEDAGRTMRFLTSNTERLSITSDGNLILGKTNYDPKFYMTSTGGNGINERFYIDGYAHGGGSAYGGGFRLHTRDTVNVFHQRLTIDSGGNVGIGTTSPSEIFQVNKNNAGNIVGAYLTNSQANTGTESVSIAFGLNRSGGDFVRQVKAITFGAEQQWTGTESTVDGYLSFSTVLNETVGEKMRITSSGVACFSNTICAPLLTVNSAVRIYGSAGGIGCTYIVTAAGTNEQPAIILEKAGGYGQSEIRTYYNNVPNYGMAFRAGNTTGVYINSSGYLGIGISNPEVVLHIYCTVANDNGGHIKFENGNTGTGSAANAQLIGKSKYGTGQYMIWENYGIRFGMRSTDNSGQGGVHFTYGTDTVGMILKSDGTLSKSGNSSTMRILPATDNTGYVGESVSRWAAMYAVNGTIQTSDAREKKDIVTSDLGLDFIKELNPVSYKWKVGENVVTYETITNADGKEEIKEIVTPREGRRTHYGFIAQEVKEVLGEKDFGGYVYDTEFDKMSLRYDQFIAPLVKGMQEQQCMIDTLKSCLGIS